VPRKVEQRLSSMDRGVSSAGPRAGSAGMERERMRLAILSEAAIVSIPIRLSNINCSEYIEANKR
jgi:hypothetical protein